jgi:outer membrane protein assembly factor BamB
MNKTLLKVAGLFAVGALGAGSWYATREDYALWAIEPRSDRVLWTRGLGADADSSVVRLLSGASGTIYLAVVPDKDATENPDIPTTELRALSADDGSLRWAQTLTNTRFTRSETLLFDGEQVLAYIDLYNNTADDARQRLEAFTARDGARRWVLPIDASVEADPIVSHPGEIIALPVQNDKPTLLKIDSATGQPQAISNNTWFDSDVSRYTTLIGADPRNLLLYSNGTLTLLDAQTGAQAQTWSDLRKFGALYADLVIGLRSTIDADTVVAFDTKTGQTRWQTPITTRTIATLSYQAHDGDLLHLISDEFVALTPEQSERWVFLISIDLTNGTLLRKVALGKGDGYTARVQRVAGGHVVQLHRQQMFIADGASEPIYRTIDRNTLSYDAQTDRLFEVTAHVPRWRRWLAPWINTR